MVFEKAHPLIRDKWVVREVARRWMPRRLSQRMKIGFWTTVFRRMDVAEAYFQDCLVRELFELSREEMRNLVRRADQDLKMRLLHLDVWAHVCLHGCAVDDSSAKIASHVTIRPE
jgi:asparagine synthase (glutamine-hydrolysing)